MEPGDNPSHTEMFEDLAMSQLDKESDPDNEAADDEEGNSQEPDKPNQG
jgi:hypothetical protein